MSRRKELHSKLEEFLGSNSVYFNPPSNHKILEYPCIVYSRASLKTGYANNKPYLLKDTYEITLITKNPDEGESWLDPDSEDALYRKFEKTFIFCRHGRHFVNVPRLVWDNIGEKIWEAGVSKGVFFPMINGTTGAGIAWNGLSSVSESSNGGDANKIYADNIIYATIRSAAEFTGTIEAYTYPDAFSDCVGSMMKNNGALVIHQQKPKPFCMAYRTEVGNDTEGEAYGYKIHLLYGLTASVAQKERRTFEDSINVDPFSWDVDSDPWQIEGHDEIKPVSHLEIDKVSCSASTTLTENLATLESALYGTENTTSRMPTPKEVYDWFGAAA